MRAPIASVLHAETHSPPGHFATDHMMGRWEPDGILENHLIFLEWFVYMQNFGVLEKCMVCFTRQLFS